MGQHRLAACLAVKQAPQVRIAPDGRLHAAATLQIHSIMMWMAQHKLYHLCKRGHCVSALETCPTSNRKFTTKTTDGIAYLQHQAEGSSARQRRAVQQDDCSAPAQPRAVVSLAAHSLAQAASWARLHSHQQQAAACSAQHPMQVVGACLVMPRAQVAVCSGTQQAPAAGFLAHQLRPAVACSQAQAAACLGAQLLQAAACLAVQPVAVGAVWRTGVISRRLVWREQLWRRLGWWQRRAADACCAKWARSTATTAAAAAAARSGAA